MKFSPINDIVKLYTKSRFIGIQKFLDNPLDVQRDMLAKMVKSAASTEYGKQYGFKFIKTYEEFKRTVPIREYESLSPYIQRIRNGEQNVLWPTKIIGNYRQQKQVYSCKFWEHKWQSSKRRKRHIKLVLPSLSRIANIYREIVTLGRKLLCQQY